jgi:hypothetical protein
MQLTEVPQAEYIGTSASDEGDGYAVIWFQRLAAGLKNLLQIGLWIPH